MKYLFLLLFCFFLSCKSAGIKAKTDIVQFKIVEDSIREDSLVHLEISNKSGKAIALCYRIEKPNGFSLQDRNLYCMVIASDSTHVYTRRNNGAGTVIEFPGNTAGQDKDAFEMINYKEEDFYREENVVTFEPDEVKKVVFYFETKDKDNGEYVLNRNESYFLQVKYRDGNRYEDENTIKKKTALKQVLKERGYELLINYSVTSQKVPIILKKA